MNTKVLILLFIALAIGWASCKKENGDLPPVVAKSNLYLINAGADILNIFQNGTRIDNTTSFFTSGALGYYQVMYGIQNYQLKKAGTTDVLISFPLTLDTARAYSLFIAGETSDKIFLVKDTIPNDTTTNNAWVRVVNASPMITNVDVAISSIKSSTNYKNASFKSATAFVPIAPGPYTLNVYQAGTTGSLVTSKTLNLAENTAYTLFTYGIINGIDNSVFGAKLISNGTTN